MKRTDTASRIIMASPETLYQAHLDPTAIAAWRPPKGMSCRIYAFNPQEGGTYRMAFIYDDKEQAHGKTTEHEDVFTGRFLELIPNKKIVEVVSFESADPAFAGEIKFSTTFTAVASGTEVDVIAENVPPGIKREDHQAGMDSSLQNLAEFTE
ncbi:SRPBCC domain-containing protein [Chitinophaga niabensis]|uniref:Uncharacterized conserved protein YndB, AHSA1/START domain n=1 Tax=Chitinophaga niabensis TaxID=536979 RepID=A0A1N6JRM1_9BACT|nr:SRPBCC domain-containing protein [Chitinophaga niabensis]SIO46950.1 Uncharacterized conserved protein YndB, AHSA1/START domain [Chitinophaga niabensis]